MQMNHKLIATDLISKYLIYILYCRTICMIHNDIYTYIVLKADICVS